MKQVTLALCGQPWTGSIVREEYARGGAALEFVAADGERITTLSAYVEPLGVNEVAIKDYSENEGVLVQLLRLNIVRPAGRRVASGHVTMAVCRIIAPELLAESKLDLGPDDRDEEGDLNGGVHDHWFSDHDEGYSEEEA